MFLFGWKLYFGKSKLRIIILQFRHVHYQVEPNTFQAVLATDGTRSYATFTYECGKLNWVDYGAAIGFSASDDFFAEHPLSRKLRVNEIACINRNSSKWSNLAYKISNIAGQFMQ